MITALWRVIAAFCVFNTLYNVWRAHTHTHIRAQRERVGGGDLTSTKTNCENNNINRFPFFSPFNYNICISAHTHTDRLPLRRPMTTELFVHD